MRRRKIQGLFGFYFHFLFLGFCERNIENSKILFPVFIFFFFSLFPSQNPKSRKIENKNRKKK